MNHDLMNKAFLYAHSIVPPTDMGPNERVLLFIMAQSADVNNTLTGFSHTQLGDLCGMERKTAMATVHKLEKRGIVTQTQVKGQRSSYLISIPEVK